MADAQPVPETKVPAEPYRLTPREQAVRDSHLARRKGRAPTPPVLVNRGEHGTHIAILHPEPTVGKLLLMDALGTLEPAFMEGLVGQLSRAEVPGCEDVAINFMVAMIRGIKPRDEIESALAAQMAAVHHATMAFTGAFKSGQTVHELNAAAAGFAKLARTFTAQIQALKHHRGGGDQKVTVEQVTVNDGGQAIVGQIGMGGVAMGGVENPPSTPCTGAENAAERHDDACGLIENPASTPCTGAPIAADRHESEPGLPENPPSTPCTGTAIAEDRRDDACGLLENPPSTPCTGVATGWRRRPGAYARGLPQNPAASP